MKKQPCSSTKKRLSLNSTASKMDPKTAPFQPDDKVFVIPTKQIAIVVYQYENEDGDGWGNVRLRDEVGKIFHANNWQLRHV
jgi:hypothetical protein